MQKASGIAAEIAAGLPTMTDLRFCCYTKPPYTDHPGNATNIRVWQMSEQRRQSDRELKRQGFIKAKPKN
jgi:hypothetical protein